MSGGCWGEGAIVVQIQMWSFLLPRSTSPPIKQACNPAFSVNFSTRRPHHKPPLRGGRLRSLAHARAHTHTRQSTAFTALSAAHLQMTKCTTQKPRKLKMASLQRMQAACPWALQQEPTPTMKLQRQQEQRRPPLKTHQPARWTGCCWRCACASLAIPCASANLHVQRAEHAYHAQ